MTTERNDGKPLTGKKVLLMVVAFFAVIVASNAFMITKSVTSFRGEDTKKSYLQGLNYNDTLEAREAQKAAGWTAELDRKSNQVKLTIKDKNNQPVSRLNPVGKLRHPTDTAKDLVLTFTAIGPGLYATSLPEGIKGQRILLTQSETDRGFTFETRNELWLQ